MVSKTLVDIKENDLIKYDNELLSILLRDHSSKKNIIWATDNYAYLGEGYDDADEMTVPLITGKNGDIIKPRVNKNKTEQLSRVRDKAGVFTPSWICNTQNNLIGEAWFARKDVFNKELTNAEGDHSWESVTDVIIFPEGKSWKDYVRENRLTFISIGMFKGKDEAMSVLKNVRSRFARVTLGVLKIRRIIVKMYRNMYHFKILRNSLILIGVCR